MLKKSLKVLSLSLMAAFSAPVLSAPSIAVTQIVEHPALDSVRQGIKDELAAQGYLEGKNMKWSYESAQGNPTTASQIARKFVGENHDVIVAIATPSAQTAAAATRNIPLVFAAVTDPVGARLVKSLEKPGKNITGVTDMLPIKQHLELVKKVVPSATRIGVLYNPGEANSVSLLSLVEAIAPELDLEITKSAVTKTSEVLGAARSLVGKVDAIYLPTDNTVISAVEAVVKVGKQNKLPVIAADTDTVKRGAIAALGFNYYDVGRQAGSIVSRILNGEKPGDIDVEGVEKTELYLNPSAADAMGVTLSPALINAAKEIVGN